VLYDVASEYNKGIAEIFKASFEEKGGRIVAFETYTTKRQGLLGPVDEESRGGARRDLPPQLLQRGALQVQQAIASGSKAPFVGSDSWGATTS